MLDFIIAVDDPVTWHTMNLLQNRKHYSILKLLGPTKISSIQNEYGASIYYNTLVPVDGRVKCLFLIYALLKLSFPQRFRSFDCLQLFTMTVLKFFTYQYFLLLFPENQIWGN